MSIIMIFSFAGCSKVDNIMELLPFFEKKELTEIPLSQFGEINVVDFDMNDRYIAVLYDDHISEEELEERGEDEREPVDCYVAVYDTLWNKFSESISVSTWAFSVSCKEDTFIVRYSTEEVFEGEGNNMINVYDYKLNLCDTHEESEKDGIDEPDKNIDTIDGDHFTWAESVAYNESFLCYDLMVFYNDNEYYYLRPSDNHSYIRASYEKKLLEHISGDENDNDIHLVVNDYESRTCLNTLTLKDDREYDSVGRARINGEYAVFYTYVDDGRSDKLYIWRYNLGEGEKTELDCRVVNDNDFDAECKAVKERIEKEYGICVEIFPDSDDYRDHMGGDIFFYKWENNIKNSTALLFIYNFEYCLGTLPKELYTEMLCKDIKEPVCSFENLKFLLVGTIPGGEADAFANNMNDDLYIVYSCDGFNYSTFCHELMHNMEYRIWNYEKDFDNEWLMLNPNGFVYDENYGENYYSNESYEDYFTRDYGTKNDLEDRATVFETICDVAHFKSDPWYKEHKPLMKKATLLNNVIKKSFPSLSTNAPWDDNFKN